MPSSASSTPFSMSEPVKSILFEYRVMLTVSYYSHQTLIRKSIFTMPKLSSLVGILTVKCTLMNILRGKSFFLSFLLLVGFPLFSLCIVFYLNLYRYAPLLFDFSSNGKQIRVMSGISEDAMPVQYYDVTLPDQDTGRAATNITSDIESSWNTVSTVNNNLELPSSRDSAYFPASTTKIIRSPIDGSKYAVCYADGSFSIDQDIYCGHAPGQGPDVAFLAGARFVVSTSSVDGTMVLWEVVRAETSSQ